MKYTQCVTCHQRVVWISLIGNTVLVILKISAGLIGNSNALVADGLHSSADVIIAIVTLVAIAISGKGHDKEHPYGHGKIESIAAALVTGGLLVAVVLLFNTAITDLKTGKIENPRLITFFVALISIITNEIMFHLNYCAGKERNSPALTANAWHNRYDSFTSVVVALGILGSFAGLKMFDPIAALFVGVVIVKISLSIFKDAYEALMDSAIDDEIKERIADSVKKMKEVNNIIKIEGRQIGQKMWIDMVIEIAADLTVTQCHEITERIQETLFYNFDSIEDVQIEVSAS